ncbi:MAG: glycoside hydrolase family 113 [Longimicrobiales bacterium]
MSSRRWGGTAAVAALGVLAVGVTGFSVRSPDGAGPLRIDGPRLDLARIHGASLEAPRRPTPPDRMAEVAELGADWVAVIPYAFIRRETGEVVFDRDGQYWGERSEGVRIQVEQARDHGMKVLLKPHVWLRGGSGWAGEYVPESEEEWRRWEEGYRAYVLGGARLAAELDVGMFCIGTELTRLVDERPDFFRRLIADVRDLYDGPVTYAANWDAYARTPFWDDLDFIGVDAYFPLSSDPGASVAELVEAWRPIVSDLREFAARHDRPVLFTEYGYRSVEGAAGEQWSLPSERRTDPSLVDPDIQARAYEALFRTVWDEPWFRGGFFWEWHLATGDRGWGGDGGGRVASVRAAGFTPEGKPAEEMVRRWYGGGE